MITNLKKTIWALALLFSVGSLLVISSCSEDDPDPTIPPSFSYQPTQVDVGSEATIVPAYQGDPATFEITNADGTENFVAIASGTGILAVSASATEGEYNVVVKATNAGGSSNATAKITVSEPVIAPGLSYTATTVEVGKEGAITAAVQGSAATYEIKSMIDSMDNAIEGEDIFVTVDASTGNLSVAKGSTTGAYKVTVEATNAAGAVEAVADITISINAEFDPSSKSLLWRYFMNNTEEVVMKNLNTLPGQDHLPTEIPIPVGWPGGVAFQINPAAENLETFFTFTAVQELLMQVPGDDACKALVPEEKGNTLLVIVNDDLTLSTKCTMMDDSPGSVTLLGPSRISYANDGFVWSLDLTLEGIPVTFPITGAKIGDFMDPLDPHYSQPSGVPRTFSAIQGTANPYTTPTDYASPLTSLAFLNVDVVMEILP